MLSPLARSRSLLPLLLLLVSLGPLSGAAGADAGGLQLFEQLQNQIITVSDQVKASVVHIEVVIRQGEQRRKGLGSGLILSPDGKIVTNHHVIDRAQSIKVILHDKSELTASVLRRDQQTDLALLQIQAPHPLPAAPLADSDLVKVGEWVVAIGNPYGFDRTVSFGIVSGKGRYIPGQETGIPLLNDFIQTDALIDPGNSGGPLVNLHGQVIGINSVGIGRGQGFTIPSNTVRDVITRAEVEGRLQRGWLGVYLQPLPRELARHLGLPQERGGALVSDVEPGSPAARAGLRSGDVIVAFQGQPVEAPQEESLNRFIQAVSSLEPGSEARCALVRDRTSREVRITVGTQPPVDAREVHTDFGFTARQITQALALEHRLEDQQGALVSYVARGSAAAEGGLEVGDVILAVEGRPVARLADLEALLPSLASQDRFLVTLKRGRVRRFSLIDLDPYRAPSGGL